MIIFTIPPIKRSNLKRGQCCWIKVSAELMHNDLCCGKPTVKNSGFCQEHKIKADEQYKEELNARD